jgi:hypothetical protein
LTQFCLNLNQSVSIFENVTENVTQIRHFSKNVKKQSYAQIFVRNGLIWIGLDSDKEIKNPDLFPNPGQ